ncbi:thioredoxin reductase-like selenoprotein T homolog CG3887 [Daktulosphaira vitifoliae]|uniref:thioredoxin reductase-like selenoprotein T homolog CG3887 n=1 Tax=Daktulosphaira vitifoliae TaxID=58002 RepID=UPI0021A97A11|nr:thioredoxin reductase-like selenoprotein T homolog CG3887 [Daktulosphaira vitifoliae]
MNYSGVAALLVLCGCLTATFASSFDEHLDSDLQLDITTTNKPRHELRVLYCHSCGYRAAYEQYSRILEEKYSGSLRIIGDKHDPSLLRLWFARFLGIAKMLLVIIIGSGGQGWDAIVSCISRLLGPAKKKKRRNSDANDTNDNDNEDIEEETINTEQQPAATTGGWRRWCADNKWTACVAVYAACSAVEAAAVATGAFEIYLDDVPVWSKIEAGRAPQPAELFQIIDSHLAMMTGTTTTTS